MDSYLVVKTLHILSSTILFGTGIGTAFHGLMSNRSGSLPARRTANRNVVIADWLFTTPAVVVQPLTGIWLANKIGLSISSGWAGVSLLLYLITVACWLPVVWIQIEIHRITSTMEEGGSLPRRYHRLSLAWFILGWPALVSMLGIFWLMVAKPDNRWF